ncbi:MAG: molecular chaperone HtpG [Caldilineaceae bacterium]|nr:molecular chaperone HtpG [Caldilineaceae bacterium]
MSDTVAPGPEKLQYQTEVKQLLDILAHSLYTEKDIFLRELISNASDALNRIQFEMLTNQDVTNADAELAIWLEPDRDAGTLRISDSGIGMNREELVTNLGTIAHSGAKAFLNGVEPGETSVEEIIGQFGVGFYSVFMVAKEVRVTSRSHCPDESAWTWISDGGSEYELVPADKASRGTEIEIRLKDDDSDFADAWRLEEIVKRHSDFVSFPIYLVEPVEPDADAEPEEDAEAPVEAAATDEDGDGVSQTKLNSQTAIWRQTSSSVSEEDYNQFFRQLALGADDPLLHIHLVTDSPVDIRTVLFIPPKRPDDIFMAHREDGLRLYSRKILIQKHNRDLLPEYLRFVEGVVDSEDLPLNVSRETIQDNPATRQISQTLARRVLRELDRLAGRDEEKYVQFWEQFGMFVKAGLATDFEHRDSLLGLLRFKSTKAGDDWITLEQYAERMPANQKSIYYVEGPDLDAARRSPHLDYYKAHDLEVLYFSDPVADAYLSMSLMDFREMKLVNVDSADVEVPDTASDEEAPTEAGEALQGLVERFKEVLGERVEDVRSSSLLVENPSRLVYAGESMSRAFERMSNLMGQEAPQQKRILELNPNHELVRNLKARQEADPADPLLTELIEQVYDNALLLEDMHPDPAAMTERILAIMVAASRA